MIDLKINEEMLIQLDRSIQQLEAIAEKRRSVEPRFESALTHFQHAYRSLLMQLDWPQPEAKLVKLGRWIGRLAGMQTQSRPGITCQSPILQGDESLRLPLVDEPAVYPTAYGFSMATSAVDMWHVIATGHYTAELTETLLWLRMIPMVRTVFDVGANVGFFSLMAAQNGSEQLKIYSFEPEPRNATSFRIALEANRFSDRIKLTQAAVGSVESTVELSICLLGSGGHSILDGRTSKNHGNQTVRVPMVTLDGFIGQSKVDCSSSLMKIDVEGFELDVLKGAAGWLASSSAPLILIETFPAGTSTPSGNDVRVVQELNRHGYRVYGVEPWKHGGATLSPMTDPANFQPSIIGNYVAVPSHLGDVESVLRQPIDARCLTPTKTLRGLLRFVTNSIENWQRASQG
jgi:FkbM family methyltransferase